MGKGEIVGPIVEQQLRGHPADVANALLVMKRRGDLVSWTPVGQRRGPDPLVVLNVRRVDRTSVRRRVRRRWVVASVAGGTVALTGAGFLAYLATAELVAHALPFLGGLVLLMHALGWVGAGQAGACPGLHCPGCKCHR